nr:LD08591p [Drosophila melanogaster]
MVSFEPLLLYVLTNSTIRFLWILVRELFVITFTSGTYFDLYSFLSISTHCHP